MNWSDFKVVYARVVLIFQREISIRKSQPSCIARERLSITIKLHFSQGACQWELAYGHHQGFA